MINANQKRTFQDDYETETNRQVEQQVVARLIKGTGLIATKLPKRDVLDFVLTMDDDVICFVEVRSKSIASACGDCYFPLKKFNVIRNHFLASKTVTALVVQFTDKVMRIWLGKTTEEQVVFWGDTRTDSDFDREPVIKIPMSRFEELWEVDS